MMVEQRLRILLVLVLASGILTIAFLMNTNFRIHLSYAESGGGSGVDPLQGPPLGDGDDETSRFIVGQGAAGGGSGASCCSLGITDFSFGKYLST